MSGPARYDASGRLLDPWAMLREMTADRDRLAAELGMVRRNHLRRMADSIWEAFDRIAPMTEETQDEALRRLTRLRDKCRAALSTPTQSQDQTK